jgi:hypothetical protein
MLLGIFAAHGVLSLECKPAYSVAALLLRHVDALEREAEEKGGVQQMLADHFAKDYQVGMEHRQAGLRRSPLETRRDPISFTVTAQATSVPSRCLGFASAPLIR